MNFQEGPGNPIDRLKNALTKIRNREEYYDHRREYPDARHFMVVRHPFHRCAWTGPIFPSRRFFHYRYRRLVSAYRDKLERLHLKSAKSYRSDYYYNLYGKHITNKFRKLAVEKFGEAAIFSEVASYTFE